MKLKDIHIAILRYIEDYNEINPFNPNVRDIADGLKYQSTGSIYTAYVRPLIDEGYIAGKVAQSKIAPNTYYLTSKGKEAIR